MWATGNDRGYHKLRINLRNLWRLSLSLLSPKYELAKNCDGSEIGSAMVTCTCVILPNVALAGSYQKPGPLSRGSGGVRSAAQLN